MGNLISGNTADGVAINGASGTVVAGNLIGTDVTGTFAIANSIGVEIDSGASENTIGGLAAVPGVGPGNLISGNATGINDSGGGDDVFEGNLIGLQAGGLAALPNTSGGIGGGWRHHRRHGGRRGQRYFGERRYRRLGLRRRRCRG